ncbi:acylphosphatase [Streptomyces sp. NPDC059008]|uniref:acylphosphatase n=1 Tax=Streptomyces sp. NPDC059008 TaxID=3346693 RepID=UPI00367C0048
MIRRRVVVSGAVQGVFFRDTCRRTADAREVAGWVRNRPDGTVEAVFEGEPERVRELVEWAHQGPATALVDAVSVTEEAPEGLRGFEIRPTPGGF